MATAPYAFEESAPSAAQPTRMYLAVIVVLAVFSVVVTAAELAIARHWDHPVQYIPWITLGVALVALALLAFEPGPARLNIARALTFLVVCAAVFGVYKHLEANYNAGGSPRGNPGWATMSETERWWAAANGDVQGPSPLAPLAMAFTGGLIFGASLLQTAAKPAHAEERSRAPRRHPASSAQHRV